MKARRRNRALLACSTVVLLLLIPVVMTAIALYRQQQQERLNRALIEAIKHKQTKTALSLLDQGAEGDARETQAQKVSAWNTFIQILRGHPPNRRRGPNPLVIALDDDLFVFPLDNPRLIEALIRHGADVNAVNEKGFTPLILAIFDENNETVRVLLEHGAMVNQRVPQFKDRTPLMAASYMGNMPVVKLLLAHHADINLKDADGVSVLGVVPAQMRDHEQIKRLLKAAGAKQ